jgi:hypothetical protein
VCHGRAGRVTFGHWRPLEVAPAPQDLAAPAPIAAVNLNYHLDPLILNFYNFLIVAPI